MKPPTAVRSGIAMLKGCLALKAKDNANATKQPTPNISGNFVLFRKSKQAILTCGGAGVEEFPGDERFIEDMPKTSKLRLNFVNNFQAGGDSAPICDTTTRFRESARMCLKNYGERQESKKHGNQYGKRNNWPVLL